MSIRVTCFASDLTDPAAIRRISMMRLGGAAINLLGFRRRDRPVPDVDGVPAIDLGRTFDSRLGQRGLQIIRHSLTALKWKDLIVGADVLLARNLEMVSLAAAARRWAGATVPLAYECLDIHKVQLGDGITARMLRQWDRRILSRCGKLVISSPGFQTRYFDQFCDVLPDIVLAENKRVFTTPQERPLLLARKRQRPWRLGWFGNIRCMKSFNTLYDFARRYPKLIEIDMRGRPTEELQRQIEKHLPLPNMRYGGRYKQDDLATLYAACDLAWAIETFDQGQNSDWALPNRLYESSYYNVPIITSANTESAMWLKIRNAGVFLNNSVPDLAEFFVNLTSDQYNALQQACAAIPTTDLVWTSDECRRFVQRLVAPL